MSPSDTERMAALEEQNRQLRAQLETAATRARQIWFDANDYLMGLPS